MLSEAATFVRFARGLRGFLNSPLSAEDCRRIAQDQIANREKTFLLVIERGVYAIPSNPYRKLLSTAGIEYGDVARMVADDGVEGALGKLHEAGVYTSIEEFKGRTPIRRGSVEIPVESEDFDNPLHSRDLTVQSSGSTAKARRLSVDFEILRHDAAWSRIHFEGLGVFDRPFGLWRPVPPGSAGIKNALILSKLGHPAERWFTASDLSWSPGRLKSNIFGAYAARASRFTAYPLPIPEYTAMTNARKVAEWLGEKRRAGTPANIDTPASSGTRIAIAARDADIDISGSFFRIGGEPATDAKTALLRELGCRFSTNWAMAEIGRLAYGCCNPDVGDEMHLLKGKMAVRQVSKEVHGESVGAFFVSTLHVNSPKIMINTEIGDSGVMTERRCGCPLEKAGLAVHVHTLRSYEKLTTAGMHFLGSDFVKLVEETLPARFGGHSTNYQFREQIGQDGVAQVSVVISPSVGEVSDDRVVEEVVAFLGARSRGDSMMANHWLQSGVLTVVREEPEMLATQKTPALRVHRQ